MPFLLRRGGKNVPLEVQRWQYFLLRNKIPQAGAIDAQFGTHLSNSPIYGVIVSIGGAVAVHGRASATAQITASGPAVPPTKGG